MNSLLKPSHTKNTSSLDELTGEIFQIFKENTYIYFQRRKIINAFKFISWGQPNLCINIWQEHNNNRKLQIIFGCKNPKPNVRKSHPETHKKDNTLQPNGVAGRQGQFNIQILSQNNLPY